MPGRRAVEVDRAVSGLRSDLAPEDWDRCYRGGGHPYAKVALCRKGGLRAAAGRTLDLLRACRRTLVRTTRNRPAYRAFSLEPADDRPAASPVSVRHDADAQAACSHEKGLQMQAFFGAAEGIRTLDLLHGKQLVGLSA